jgi:hypothetical protein
MMGAGPEGDQFANADTLASDNPFPVALQTWMCALSCIKTQLEPLNAASAALKTSD